jgi:hypothetical protein
LPFHQKSFILYSTKCTACLYDYVVTTIVINWRKKDERSEDRKHYHHSGLPVHADSRRDGSGYVNDQKDIKTKEGDEARANIDTLKDGIAKLESKRAAYDSGKADI